MCFMALRGRNPSEQRWQMWRSVWIHTLCFYVSFIVEIWHKVKCESFTAWCERELRTDLKTRHEWRDFRGKAFRRVKEICRSQKVLPHALLFHDIVQPVKLWVSLLLVCLPCSAALSAQMMTAAEIQKATFPGFPEAFLGTVHLPSSRGGIIFRRLLGKRSLKGLVFKICV